MEKYFINYHTGAGNEHAQTLEEAMKKADKGAAYTQQDITIEDNNNTVILRRRWCGIAYNPETADDSIQDIIQFGKFGYFAAWEEEE